MTIVATAAIACIVAVCDCSDLQLDVVGCECGGEPRRRPTYEERVAEQDRIADALIERALDREERAERADWEAEQAKDLARGWDWDAAWGEQPADQHVRAFRAEVERVEAILVAAA
jgi:hypothetical protein